MPPLRRLVVLLTLALSAAAAWSGSALAAPAPPVNVELPVISGRPQVGATLSVTTGVWKNSPTIFTYQWQRCDTSGLNCLPISGATQPTRVATAADAGLTLMVVVTATNGTGPTDANTDPFPIGAFVLNTPHFSVHYSSDPTTRGAITQTMAGDVGANAERAYAAELADGYPAPMSDGVRGGDSRTDIYVGAIADPGVLAYAVPDTAALQTSGYIILNATIPDALNQETIAHELFHLVQFGIWLPPAAGDYWLLEGSAEWMAFRVDGFRGSLSLGSWDMALDCRDPLGTSQCDLKDDYKNGGYSRWPFFEFLSERWGPGFTRTIFTQGANGGTALTALSNAITAKGSSLTDVFNDWSTANLTGGYTVGALQGMLPPTYASISTGTLASLNAKTQKGAAVVTTGPLAPVTVSINHLSTRYIAIKRGSTAADTPCYKATLILNVTLPAGVAAKPFFWWPQLNADGTKQAAQSLSINGTAATITLPWDTCDWGSTQGYLSLPNPSTTVDSADFAVSGSLVVDRSSEATATPPPDPVRIAGNSVDATNADVPRIQVVGPQLIHLSATSRQLRVIVQSSDTGSLKAALGSLVLGSGKLRAGSNDVRFNVPESALRSLRSTSAASNALTLTPVSPGGAVGTAVVRKVTIDATAKPAKKSVTKSKPAKR
jgi:hypothetical protein